ncbi:phosphoribosyltransferase family protein [Kaarinaea lacus]
MLKTKSKQLDNIRSLFKHAGHCVLCGAPGHNDLDLCEPCYFELRPTGPICSCCALPLNNTDDQQRLCGSCLQSPPPYTLVYRFAEYTPPLDRIIQQLKFNQKLHLARLLAMLMARDIRQLTLELPDVLLPVPLHKQRLQHRGYNQALEIARILAKKLNVKLDRHACIRQKFTREQTGLPAKQRKTNLKGAFEVRGDVQGKHIAIVDDVMTTGSTVAEISKALTKQGADRVDVWVCARANV